LVSLLVEVLGVFGEELRQARRKRIERGIFVTPGLVFGQQLGKVGALKGSVPEVGIHSHSLTVSAPASSRSEQPGPPLPDYDLLRKPPWAAAWHYPATQS